MQLSVALTLALGVIGALSAPATGANRGGERSRSGSVSGHVDHAAAESSRGHGGRTAQHAAAFADELPPRRNPGSFQVAGQRSQGGGDPWPNRQDGTRAGPYLTITADMQREFRRLSVHAGSGGAAPRGQPQGHPQFYPQDRPRGHSQVSPQVDSQFRPQFYPQDRPLVHPQVNQQVHPQFYPQERAQVHQQVDPQVYQQFHPRVRPQVQPQGQAQAQAQVQAQVQTQIRPQVHPHGHPEVNPQVQPQVQHEVQPQQTQVPDNVPVYDWTHVRYG